MKPLIDWREDIVETRADFEKQWTVAQFPGWADVGSAIKTTGAHLDLSQIQSAEVFIFWKLKQYPPLFKHTNMIIRKILIRIYFSCCFSLVLERRFITVPFHTAEITVIHHYLDHCRRVSIPGLGNRFPLLIS